MITQQDRRDLLLFFNTNGVQYLVIGGHAVSAHAVPRGTKDLDVFIKALTEFRVTLADTTPADFNDKPSSVFQLGVEPGRIDILQGIAGVDFDEAWGARAEMFLEQGLPAHVMSVDHLIRNKLAVRRHQNLADLEKLRAAEAAKQKVGGRASKRTRKQPPQSSPHLKNSAVTTTRQCRCEIAGPPSAPTKPRIPLPPLPQLRNLRLSHLRHP